MRKYETRQFFGCTRVGAYCIDPQISCDDDLGLKPAGFFMYPCRGVLHTPPNVLRRRVGPKTGCVFDVFRCGNVKPVKFFMYPCRGVLHTPPNVPRQRFKPKTGCVFGVSVCGSMKLGGF